MPSGKPSRQNQRPGTSAQIAARGHNVMGIIVLMSLALELHLWWIDASADVAGGGIFLFVVWVGLPAVFFAGSAVRHSLKSGQQLQVAASLMLLAMVLALALADTLHNALPLVLFNVLAVSYLGLVATMRARSWREGADSKGDR